MADTGSCAESPCKTVDGESTAGINPCGTNVDAVPFTPRNSTLSTTSTVLSALSPNAPEFYPRNYAALIQDKNALKSPLTELQQTIATLIERPGDFDQVMAPLVESLVSSVKDIATLDAIVGELFMQSVQEANFHYSGARVCCYLSEHLKLPFGSFHDRLASRCQDEYRSQMSTTASPEDESSLIGFTIFMGELLVSMKDVNNCLFLTELPDHIAQLVFTLVTRNTNDSLQCAVQVLKLTGAVLEDHGINLNQIFAELEKTNLNSELTQFMISGVTEQRANNWGRRGDEIAAAAGAGDTKNYISNTDADLQATDEPVFFDYRNGAYSGEEADEFQAYNNWSGTDGHNTNLDNNMQYWIGDQVMDQATATAFEEFIAECGPPPLPNYWSCRP